MKSIRFALFVFVMAVGLLLSFACITPADNQVNEPVGKVATEFPSYGPFIEDQWDGLNTSLATADTVDNEVLVAILDTGIDINHKDLVGKVVESVNFTKSPTKEDMVGHGTHVAGIVAFGSSNNIALEAASPDVKLLNVKVAEDSGLVWGSDVAEGIIWATDRGAQVINMSLALPTKYKPVEDAVKYAWDRGVVLTAASGNYVQCKTYPGAYENVLAVAATTFDGKLWEGSNHSDFVNAYAPGVSILSTVPGNKYAYQSGTSMASAFVSAVGAQAINGMTDTNNNGKYSDELTDLLKKIFPKSD